MTSAVRNWIAVIAALIEIPPTILWEVSKIDICFQQAGFHYAQLLRNCPAYFLTRIIVAMMKVGLPDNVPQLLLQEFPEKDIEIVALPDKLDGTVEVEFWIPPLFGWHSASVFAHLRGVRVVQCLLAGVDWIVPWLPKDIVLCDGQGIHSIPVAEWIVGAILGTLKRFPEYRDWQREEFWNGQVAKGRQSGGRDTRSPAGYRILGDELAGKRVLIVGYGGIGVEVERLLQPFDVKIARISRTAKPGISPVSELENLLPEADVVVLLVPLTDATRNLMNSRTLERMKDGAILVNAARGPVVDTDALVTQLQTGRIHAVLDVTEPEPLPPGHPLWSAPNCFITPHVAASVERYVDRGIRFAAAQVRRYLIGEPLHNRVNEVGY